MPRPPLWPTRKENEQHGGPQESVFAPVTKHAHVHSAQNYRFFNGISRITFTAPLQDDNMSPNRDWRRVRTRQASVLLAMKPVFKYGDPLGPS